MDEIWKDIVGFEGRYQVSNIGNIRGLSRPLIYKDGRKGTLPGKPIKGVISSTGYICVTLDSKSRRLVHRLVAEAFLPQQKYRVIVNHIDGNKANNCLNNLEWATYAENNHHARAKGLNRQHGENCNLAKYTDQFINAVKAVHSKYHARYDDLGKIFGIHPRHAYQIVTGRTRAMQT
jgi:hypothetical protein